MPLDTVLTISGSGPRRSAMRSRSRGCRGDLNGCRAAPGRSHGDHRRLCRRSLQVRMAAAEWRRSVGATGNTRAVASLSCTHGVAGRPFAVIPCCVFSREFSHRILPDGTAVTSYDQVTTWPCWVCTVAGRTSHRADDCQNGPSTSVAGLGAHVLPFPVHWRERQKMHEAACGNAQASGTHATVVSL